MISYSQYEKIYENLNELTELYSKLVEIAKKFEGLLGDEDIATTNLMEAIAKINELILKYSPASDELNDSSVDEIGDADNLDTPDGDFDFDPAQNNEEDSAQGGLQDESQGEAQGGLQDESQGKAQGGLQDESQDEAQGI